MIRENGAKVFNATLVDRREMTWDLVAPGNSHSSEHEATQILVLEGARGVSRSKHDDTLHIVTHDESVDSLPESLRAVLCPCCFNLCPCSCLTFRLTFALVNCANVHVNWASRIPSFLRAHVTLDGQDHLSCTQCQFLRNATEDVLAALAALLPSALQSSRSGPAPCRSTLTGCRCSRHQNQHCSDAGA